MGFVVGPSSVGTLALLLGNCETWERLLDSTSVSPPTSQSYCEGYGDVAFGGQSSHLLPSSMAHALLNTLSPAQE